MGVAEGWEARQQAYVVVSVLWQERVDGAGVGDKAVHARGRRITTTAVPMSWPASIPGSPPRPPTPRRPPLTAPTPPNSFPPSSTFSTSTPIRPHLFFFF